MKTYVTKTHHVYIWTYVYPVGVSDYAYVNE